MANSARFYRSMAREEYVKHAEFEACFPMGLEWSDGRHGFPLGILKLWIDRGDNMNFGGISSGRHDLIVSVISEDEREFRIKTYADIYAERHEKAFVSDNVPMEPMRFINTMDIPIERAEIIYDPRGFICTGGVNRVPEFVGNSIFARK